MTHFMPEDEKHAAAMLRQMEQRVAALEAQNTDPANPNVLRSTDEGATTGDSVATSSAASTAFVWGQTSWNNARTWE